jgi:hypothetical protein
MVNAAEIHIMHAEEIEMHNVDDTQSDYALSGKGGDLRTAPKKHKKCISTSPQTRSYHGWVRDITNVLAEHAEF